MKKIINIERENAKPSKIIIGELLNNIDDYLPSKRVVIITDSNIHRRYREIIDRYDHIIIGLGETNKTLVTADRVYAELIKMDADRQTFILGFGGGVVTDIAGFVASTYMRGVEFGFIASSLLGQVDASIGGKNGVNVGGYKNMIGVFNQPQFVLCDPAVLNTLPEREFKAGLAEVIKAGIISDPTLFELFEGHSFEQFKEDNQLLEQMVTRAIEVKVELVERDEFDLGERQKLNLGHSFAHAIEKNHSSYLHGEAVAFGMVIASNIAYDMGLLERAELERIENVIARMEFGDFSTIDTKSLYKALRHDKKRNVDMLNLILPTQIGKCVVKEVELERVQELLNEFANKFSKQENKFVGEKEKESV